MSAESSCICVTILATDVSLASKISIHYISKDPWALQTQKKSKLFIISV